MKKAAFSLSVSAIVVLILAIVMLGLGITFIKGMFGQSSGQFEELISQEPEPPTPDIKYPITLSRDYIITNSGETEIIKVGVFNPLHFDWGQSFTLGTAACCGVNDDGVCYVEPSVACTGLSDDTDCAKLDEDHCSVYDGICYFYVNDFSCGEDPDGIGPAIWKSFDINCGYAGVYPLLNCTNLDLGLENYQFLAKKIKSSSSETFNVIFEVPNTEKGTYLCNAAVWPFTKYSIDFTINIIDK